MLNIELHQNIETNILKDIYTDPLLRSALGFKGGTAAMFFYGLPRFSVDLDFNLISDKKEAVFLRLKEILSGYGELIQAVDKEKTLFFLLIYKKGERNLKVEISKRFQEFSYETKNYLGIPVLVMVEADMAAAKLCALVSREELATRDIFDLWYFLKNNWKINTKLVKEISGLDFKEALEKAKKRVMSVKKTALLAGMGDLLDNKQKAWVKDNLQEDLRFLMEIYKK